MFSDLIIIVIKSTESRRERTRDFSLGRKKGKNMGSHEGESWEREDERGKKLKEGRRPKDEQGSKQTKGKDRHIQLPQQLNMTHPGLGEVKMLWMIPVNLELSSSEWVVGFTTGGLNNGGGSENTNSVDDGGIWAMGFWVSSGGIWLNPLEGIEP